MVQTLRRAAVIANNTTMELPQGDVLDGGAPPGAVDLFAMSIAPAGYLKANGAAVSRTAYANLFAAIGTAFGTGDGSTTFNLPDLRGQFLRVWADNGSLDSGRSFGSTQAQALQGHGHSLPMGFDTNGFYGWSGSQGGPVFGGNTTTANKLYAAGTYSTGAALTYAITASDLQNATGETRPANIALLACIKF